VYVYFRKRPPTKTGVQSECSLADEFSKNGLAKVRCANHEIRSWVRKKPKIRPEGGEKQLGH
jgi:hypothetical protein